MDVALSTLLTIVPVIIPVVATTSILVHNVGISERHHRHHDTYLVAGTLTWSLVFAMVYMGALGTLLVWLCAVGVFVSDPMMVLCFFDAFLIVTFGYWVLLRHYKVVTYEDRLEVTPFFGPTTSINYQDITLMEWAPSLLIAGRRNVRVHVGNKSSALLWSALDLEQILIRIDRFDVFENYALA